MRTFHGCVFLSREELEKVGKNYPIKVEYYKTMEETKYSENYGIEVIKTEYIDNDIKLESIKLDNITSNEDKINNVLDVLRKNGVTPVAAEDVITDLIYT